MTEHAEIQLPSMSCIDLRWINANAANTLLGMLVIPNCVTQRIPCDADPQLIASHRIARRAIL